MAEKNVIASGISVGTLGLKTKGRDVIENPTYYRSLLGRHKAIGFIGLHPTEDQHFALLEGLYGGGDDQSPIPQVLNNLNHSYIKDVENWEQKDYFVYQHWHVDHAFFEHTTSLISMHMKTFSCPPNRGQTHLASLIDLYNAIPNHIKKHLPSAEFESWTGCGEHEPVSHPALRTHPITGEVSLYWTGADTRLVGGSADWFDELKLFVQNYLLDQANWWTWEWSEGDFLIWDNRCLIHSFSPGWRRDQRVFNRGCIGLEKPYFDPSASNEVSNAHSDDGSTIPTGPSRDHIPLVFTHGIYGLRELRDNYQKVTLLHVGESPSAEVHKFIDQFRNRSDFSFKEISDSSHQVMKHLCKYAQYLIGESFSPGQIYVVSKNGDVVHGFRSWHDLFSTEAINGCAPPFEMISGLLRSNPELRHAGHFWHYPDWFKHQQIAHRPWDYRNLPFYSYNERPSEDFLIQYAIDTVFGCFNHYIDDAGRKRVIERIQEYLSYMLDIEEYRSDR